ncbi:MAG: 4Fe-4S binding protein [Treponema sp.]|jgi:ferredoxin|nr:4Fe-4S binding protein [Treponema sp.]
MAYKITDACVSCGVCVSECPLDAISEKDGQYIIDADACTDCGVCVGSCPADAIVAG